MRMEMCIDKRETAPPWEEMTWQQARLPGLEWSAVETLESPADVGNWVCPATILAWVAHEVELQSWTELQPADWEQQFPVCQRKMMLCVLAYAYARQMFDAEEIADACEADPVLHRLCGGRPPFALDLQRLRRSHRAMLEKILTEVFTNAIRHRFDLGTMSLPAELEGDLHRLAAERLDIARHMECITTTPI